MERTITNALGRTGANLLKTGAALLVTTIASNTLREQTNLTLRSAAESYSVVKETMSARKSIGNEYTE